MGWLKMNKTICIVSTKGYVYNRSGREILEFNRSYKEKWENRIMWKITFNYSDGSKTTLTNRSKTRDMDKELANKYWDTYGRRANNALYQHYPIKKYKAISFSDVVQELNVGKSIEEVLKGLEK